MVLPDVSDRQVNPHSATLVQQQGCSAIEFLLFTVPHHGAYANYPAALLYPCAKCQRLNHCRCAYLRYLHQSLRYINVTAN